jgi:hypothetical protein
MNYRFPSFDHALICIVTDFNHAALLFSAPRPPHHLQQQQKQQRVFTCSRENAELTRVQASVVKTVAAILGRQKAG